MEAVRPSLFMRAAPIGVSDPWVLAATSGSVRLTPIRMMSAQDRRRLPEEGVLLNLTELGLFDRDGAQEACTSLLTPTRFQVVLLLPWSVVPTLVGLDALARRSSFDSPLPDDDWLATWHHFVEAGDTPSPMVAPTMTRTASALDVLLSPGPWRYVFGAVCGDRQRSSADRFDVASVKGDNTKGDDRRVAKIVGPKSSRREMASPSPGGAGATELSPVSLGSGLAVH
jgi:hypothetical protein